MKTDHQKFIFQTLEIPAPAVAEKEQPQAEKIAEAKPDTAGKLADLRDEVTDTMKTQKQEASSVRIEQAAGKAGGFKELFEEIGKLIEQFGRLTDEFLAQLGLKQEDVDCAAPAIEQGAEEKPDEAQKYDRLGEVFKEKYLAEYVSNASNDFDVPAWAILAIVRQESHFKQYAQSPFTSAKGMCQAVDGTWKAFLNAPDNKYFKEAIWTDPKTGQSVDSRFNPEAAIYFTAWYMKNLIREVDYKIGSKGAIEGYLPEWRLKQGAKIETEDMQNISLAYHSGAEGYLRWRRYQETGRGEEKLFSWQKREVTEVNGRRWMSYEQEATTYQTNVTKYAKTYAQQI